MKLTTLFAVSVSLILSGFCSLGVQAHPVLENSSGDPVPAGAYYTDNYRNLFNEYLGISQQQTDRKMEQIWNHFFVNEKTKVYYESDDNTAIISAERSVETSCSTASLAVVSVSSAGSPGVESEVADCPLEDTGSGSITTSVGKDD